MTKYVVKNIFLLVKLIFLFLQGDSKHKINCDKSWNRMIKFDKKKSKSFVSLLENKNKQPLKRNN